MNKNLEIFIIEQQFKNIIQQSNLSIGEMYLIISSLFKEIELLFIQQVQKEHTEELLKEAKETKESEEVANE